MNKEKTAMQMLIEAMQKEYKSIDGSESYIDNVQKSEVGLRILQAKSLLQKEQEQIEQAYEDGLEAFVTHFEKEEGISTTKYYQSKYGGEDVDR